MGEKTSGCFDGAELIVCFVFTVETLRLQREDVKGLFSASLHAH